MNDGFLRLDAVTKRFSGCTVLDRVSFTVSEGEVIALLGPSGCGKTTTLRLIAGLETPDAGEIRIDDECVAANGRNLVAPHRRQIGFVFQDLALWPHLTVAGNLDFVLASIGLEKPERKEQIAETLRLVRAEALAGRHPAQLSGGEQQRVAIARAVVARPRLLLLDEPVAHLDAELKNDLLEELKSVQQRLNTTTILITHDRADAEAFARRIILMRAGKIAHAD